MKTWGKFWKFPVQDVILWSLTFSLVLLQITNYIYSPWKMWTRMEYFLNYSGTRVLCSENRKLLNFLMDSVIIFLVHHVTHLWMNILLYFCVMLRLHKWSQWMKTFLFHLLSLRLWQNEELLKCVAAFPKEMCCLMPGMSLFPCLQLQNKI